MTNDIIDHRSKAGNASKGCLGVGLVTGGRIGGRSSVEHRRRSVGRGRLVAAVVLEDALFVVSSDTGGSVAVGNRGSRSTCHCACASARSSHSHGNRLGRGSDGDCLCVAVPALGRVGEAHDGRGGQDAEEDRVAERH